MLRNRSLITLAIIVVAVQFFAFFLPTFSEVREGEDVEAYSTQQVLINYTDTINDSDAEELWGWCRMGRFVICVEYISALAFIICALRKEDDDKKAASYLLGAASSIAFACTVNYGMLALIFEESHYDKSVGLLFGATIQLLGLLAVGIIYLYVAKDPYASYKPVSTEKSPENTANKAAVQDEENELFKNTVTCPTCGQTGIPKNRRSCPKCDTIFW